MLQQTRVETVAPRYEEFLRRFPDPETLAQASEEEVLRAWAGLGYYRRARQLQAAARYLVAEEGGELPRDYESLRRLPGVGEYTAAAIASIAYGEPRAVVDGNVKRVAARVLGLELEAPDPVLHRRARAWLQGYHDELAARRAHGNAAGDLNQAVMELGATLCRPRAAECPRCPLRRDCRSARDGRALVRPAAGRAASAEELLLEMLLARRGEAVLLARRERGWNRGYFEPPLRLLRGRAPAAAALEREWEIPGGPGRFLGEFRHGITRYRLRVRVREWTGLPARLPGCWRWLGPEEGPWSTLARKAAALPGRPA